MIWIWTVFRRAAVILLTGFLGITENGIAFVIAEVNGTFPLSLSMLFKVCPEDSW
jgi:hypothetical protein